MKSNRCGVMSLDREGVKQNSLTENEKGMVVGIAITFIGVAGLIAVQVLIELNNMGLLTP